MVTIGRFASSAAGSARVRDVIGVPGGRTTSISWLSERDGPQRVVGRVLHGDAHLGVACDHQRRDLRRTLGVGEGHGHAGVRGAERAGEGRDGIDRKRRERAQIEPAGLEPTDRRDRGAGRLHVAQRLACGADECLTGSGERDAAADPVEEGSAEVVFELADRL